VVLDEQVAAPDPQALQVFAVEFKKYPELHTKITLPEQVYALAGHATQEPLTALNPDKQEVA